MINSIINMPPRWCSEICANALTDVCIEQCNIKRDTSRLRLKSNLTIANMPQLPNTDDLNRDERFKIIVIYLSKITEQLQAAPFIE